MKIFEIPDDCGWLNVNGYNVGCENIVYKKCILPQWYSGMMRF